MNFRPIELNSLLVVMITICSCQALMRCCMKPPGHVEKCKDCKSWVPLTAPEDDYILENIKQNKKNINYKGGPVILLMK